MKQPTLHKINHINGGIQELYFFDNGYGASVVKHSFSYGGPNGLWEIAVLIGQLDGYDICYTTPIASDVIGHLTDRDVLEVLTQIENLPNNLKISLI